MIAFLFTVLFLAVVYHTMIAIYHARSLYTSTPEKEQIPPKDLFFSIHVPVSSEPPNMVIHTLKLLLKQSYTRFEIIVVDNNTQDKEKWVPLQDFCRKNSTKLRYFRFSKLDGAKAGALNVALEYTDRKADYVITLDCDYKVRSSFLNKVNRHCQSSNLPIIQFPQAYICKEAVLHPLISEYSHFFEVFSTGANLVNAVLTTGTLTVIRYSTLLELNGWRSDSITEDAELGVRSVTSGVRSTYIAEVIGEGFAPYGFGSFIKQRNRWAFGNAQVLKKYFKSIVNLESSRRRALLAQLSAWINLSGISELLLLSILILKLFHWEVNLYYPSIFLLAIQSAYLFAKAYLFIKSKNGVRSGVKTLIVHTSTFIIGSYGWIPALWGAHRAFEVTAKNIPTSYRVLNKDTGYFFKTLLYVLSYLLLFHYLPIGLGLPLVIIAFFKLFSVVYTVDLFDKLKLIQNRTLFSYDKA